MQVRIVQLGQKKQLIDETEKGKSEDSNQEEVEEVEDKTRTAEEVGEMVEAVEKGEKGLEFRMRKDKRRGLPAAKIQKREQKNENGENCVRGRADWFDGR